MATESISNCRFSKNIFLKKLGMNFNKLIMNISGDLMYLEVFVILVLFLKFSHKMKQISILRIKNVLVGAKR